MEKILIVEDDPLLGPLIAGWLKVSFSVELVTDGLVALARLLECDYDAVVLDWMMPKKNGNEVLSEYRHGGGKTPILVLSARCALAEKEQCFNSGADDYLTKPFEPIELSLRVKALLRSTARQRRDLFRLGNLELDRSRHLIRVGLERIDLARREFQVLEILVQQPAVTFSAQALLRRIWSDEPQASEIAVRTSIARIRAKLKAGGSTANVVTSWGTGYTLKLDDGGTE